MKTEMEQLKENAQMQYPKDGVLEGDYDPETDTLHLRLPEAKKPTFLEYVYNLMISKTERTNHVVYLDATPVKYFDINTPVKFVNK